MHRLCLQDLKNTTATTHEGAAAYDYSGTHPLVHLVFSFGSALFTDAYYETEQEQVRRLAQALVGAARAEPGFPWQYGAWVRDPVKGKGNRIQGSLVPALLDALLDPTAHTERFVERCLRHRPDDAVAFLGHYRDLQLGEPSPAARRGMARALIHFDEYQLLKYARPDSALRLADVLAWLRPELTALGAEGARARSVGRYLHASTRDRTAVLRAAAAGEDGMVPLPLAQARRALFQMTKADVGGAAFRDAVVAARVTWEQVVGQFGHSLRVPSRTQRALKQLAGWNAPKLFLPVLWRLAFLPRFTMTEAAQALQTLHGQGTAEERNQVDQVLLALGLGQASLALEALPVSMAHTAAATAARVRCQVLEEHGAWPAPVDSLVRRLVGAQRLQEAAFTVLRRLQEGLLELRNRPTEDARLDALVPLVEAVRDAVAGSGQPVFQEAQVLCGAALELLREDRPALRALLARQAEVTARVVAAQGRLKEATKPGAPVPTRAVLEVLRADVSDLARGLREADVQAAGGPAYREAAARWHHRLGKLDRVVHRTFRELEAAVGVLDRPGRAEHNRAAWTALLDAPGLLPDMALLRNVRNLVSAGIAPEELVRRAAARKFSGVWPHQVYAGAKVEPSLEPVFEAMLHRMVDRVPVGRHLGVADASGSMSCPVGGQKSSVTCMDVALLWTALMSGSSGLGASFSDGGWGQSTYLTMAQRGPDEGVLAFTRRAELHAGMGGTQVFGAVLELVAWLKRHDDVKPPECLWFFSDMQFHPAEGALEKLPPALLESAVALGLGRGRPPLELALELYRQTVGPVDVVLWNLAVYAPVPVPSGMKGVLLVSGFDANTLALVEQWRQGGVLPAEATVEQGQEVILEAIRAY